jgi:hypothetical protein
VVEHFSYALFTFATTPTFAPAAPAAARAQDQELGGGDPDREKAQKSERTRDAIQIEAPIVKVEFMLMLR